MAHQWYPYRKLELDAYACNEVCAAYSNTPPPFGHCIPIPFYRIKVRQTAISLHGDGAAAWPARYRYSPQGCRLPTLALRGALECHERQCILTGTLCSGVRA